MEFNQTNERCVLQIYTVPVPQVIHALTILLSVWMSRGLFNVNAWSLLQRWTASVAQVGLLNVQDANDTIAILSEKYTICLQNNS